MVEGPRAVGAALDHGAVLDEVLVAGDAEPALIERARAAGARVTTVAAVDLERALSTVTPQHVVAVASTVLVPPAGIVESARAEARPVVVLAGVADPGNAGTVIRSAAASGAAGVVVTAGSVDPTNPKCVRASAGALFAVPVAVAGEVADLATWGLPVVGAAAGGRAPDEVDLGGAVALVLGAEATGLPADAPVDAVVSLPLDGGVESLNVAMAATVLLYEARRQRRGGRW